MWGNSVLMLAEETFALCFILFASYQYLLIYFLVYFLFVIWKWNLHKF